MSSMIKNRLNRLVAAPFTPMGENGDINFRMIAPYAAYLIEAGVTGAFVCGTTGEGLSLTINERKLILEAWTEASKDELKIICHVGGNCLKESVEIAAHAEKHGASLEKMHFILILINIPI